MPPTAELPEPTTEATGPFARLSDYVAIPRVAGLALSPDGRRLAECLLVDVIGLDYADVHEEACRWEHVMSEAVERKLLTLLGNPTVSPFGNPIPGLDALQGEEPLAAVGEGAAVPGSLATVAQVATGDGRTVVIGRISEQLQEDAELLRTLAEQGVRPGARMVARMVEGGITLDDSLLPAGVAQHLFVAAVGAGRTPARAAPGR